MNKKVLLLMLASLSLTGCVDGIKTTDTEKDIKQTQNVADRLTNNQPTPTDIDYSLERYNLIRRAYWVNGQKEKARTVARPAEVPLGYCVLFSEYGTVIAQFSVDGKVSSLNSYLTPNMVQEYICEGGVKEIELPDIDGSYGSNDANGVFFFTPQWQYIEWTGDYIYSDTPFKVSTTVLEEY